MMTEALNKTETTRFDPTPGKTPATEALKKETKRVGEDIARLPELAKDAARENWHNGRNRVTRTWNRGAAKVKDAREKVGETVRERPVLSMATVAAVGAGIGAAFGAWFVRKRDHEQR